MKNQKKCVFCKDGAKYLDYKNPEIYWGQLTRYGTIRARYYSGVCLHHQKEFARCVKRARHMALLSFVREN